MPSLAKDLRNTLARITLAARTRAEAATKAALENLAVHERQARGHMDQAKKELRTKLRARGKALGDARADDGAQTLTHLVEAAAYEQWHRLLFTRFLTENGLLHTDEENGDVSVSLQECDELAADLGARDGFDLACRFASRSLPGVFRSDDPVLALRLALNDEVELRGLLDKLPTDVFTASDSLGWTYQFWQAQRKDDVNESGKKIGADELPSVTQLFTEDYMVDFLLDNTLGAWHAGKVLAANPKLAERAQSEDELRQAVALPGCPWKYLRWVKGKDSKWSPAAGTFEGWPKSAAALRALDPCMGSGHFVVAMFERLVALRLAEEKQDEAAAVAAVIRDNLFGLEIDPRCTQIGAFNLALAAWRRVGHCKLPAMNLACSGLAPNTREADWLAIAGDNQKLQRGMERLYRLFQKAAVLGSLINPRAGEGDLLVAAFHELQPLLEKALAQETKDDTAHEMAVTARGLAKAAEILAGQFTLVATNPPFLGLEQQVEMLEQYVKLNHFEARRELALCFLQRCYAFLPLSGCSAFVLPGEWTFVRSNREFRKHLLDSASIRALARLGLDAFVSKIRVAPVLLISSPADDTERNATMCLDVSTQNLREKPGALVSNECTLVSQEDWCNETDCRLLVHAEPRLVTPGTVQVESIADSRNGLSAGDGVRFESNFWEVPKLGCVWEPLQSSTAVTMEFGGRERVVRWENEAGEMAELAESVKHLNHAAQNWRRGKPLWGRSGVIVNQIGAHTTIYSGDKYDGSCFAIVPNDKRDAVALVAFALHGELKATLKRINPTWNLKSPKTLLQMTLDLAHWQKVAAEKYPHGLPKPFSSDPTQWLFNGHPAGADQPLHVAVARLLGYQWPRQTGSSFPDCPALGPDGLETLADDDGIVCLSSLNREAPAAQRLRALLAKALGKFDERALLGKAGSKGSKSTTIEDWLRDECFEQHCDLSHHRPFLWHIWDGRKDGFHALVNYHKLDHATLNKLTFSTLGTWITEQAADAKAEKPGADARLGSAQALQDQLKAILDGEAPYDVFVRWKPLSQQAKGWQPDLNDGVRMNIRPFATADIFRKRVKIKWDKDRGTEPQRAKTEYPWFWCEEEPGTDPKPDKEFAGNRWNDVHLSLATKNAARS